MEMDHPFGMRAGAIRMRHYDLWNFRHLRNLWLFFIRHGNQFGIRNKEFTKQLRLFRQLWQRRIKQQPQRFRHIRPGFPEQLNAGQPTSQRSRRNRRRHRRCSGLVRCIRRRQRLYVEITKKDSSGVLPDRLVKRTAACL